MRYVGLICAVALAACASEPKESQSTTQTAPIIIGESRVIESEALGGERTINTWLPPSYRRGDARYPVLYLIDGGLDQDFHHISGLAQLGAVADMFADVIVVGIETKDRRAELTWRSTDSAENADFPSNGNSAAFRKFLTSEVKPLIDSAYRTSGEDVLIGESLAGLFIVETFLKHPDAVDTYVAISPSLWWDHGSLADEARKILDNYPKGERKFYLAVADEKGAMRDGVRKIVSALQKEQPKGIRWVFSDRPDLRHATIYHREAIEALVWAFPRVEAK